MRAARVLVLAALLALFAVPSAAHATHLAAPACDTSWTNPAGGDWGVAGNWDAGVPDFNDVACVTMSGTYTVTVASNTNIRALRVGGASGTQTISVTPAPGTDVTFDGGENDFESVVNANGVISLAGAGNAFIDTGGGNNDHPLVNHGTIRTESGGARHIRLAIENATDGTMTFNGGVRIATGRPFVNRGTLTVPAGQTFLAPATTNVEHAGGTWNNAGSTKSQGAKFVHSGGTAAGNPIEICGSEFDPSGPGAITFLVRRDTSTGCDPGNAKFIGNVAADTTVRLRNEGESTLDMQLPPAGLTINGTVTMEGGTAGPGDNRVLLGLNGVTVGASGTLRSVGLGHRIVQGPLVNNGTLQLDRGLFLDNAYTQGATGTLHSVIGGTDPQVNFGQLDAGNDAAVNGKLKTTTTITPSGTYDVVKSRNGNRTGTFATTEFVGPGYDVAYEPKVVRLTPNGTGGPPADPPPGPPPPPPDATGNDLRGEWVLETTTAGGATYTMRERYTAMDKASGRYSGSGAGGPFSWNTEGTATGNQVHFVTGPYNELLGYSATFDGTIGGDGVITGTWTDTNGQSGTFRQTRVGGGPPPPASDYLGNWTLDAFDPSGTHRFSRSIISLTKEDPAQTFTGRGSNPVHLFDAKVAVTGADVAMELSNFTGLGVYASRYKGRREGADVISGTWTDGASSGLWTMTRSSKPASQKQPSDTPTLPVRAQTSGGTSFVQVTPPASCNLSADSEGAFTRASVNSAAAKKKKPKRLSGVRVASFGPVFVQAGEPVLIPVRPAPLIKKRTRKAGVAAAASQRATVDMNVTCDPVRSPTNPDPPPGAPFELFQRTTSVPVTVPTQTKAEPRRPKAGRWVGVPRPGQGGGLTFSVSSTGEISGPGTNEPLVARALQTCWTAAGPLPNGLGKVTLNGKLTPAPSSSYPRTAVYVKNQISANGGIRGFVNLTVTFSGDDEGTAMLSGAQPTAPTGLGCSMPAQPYTLRYLGNAQPPAFTGGDGTPYVTGEDPSSLQPQPRRNTSMVLTCIRGAQPTSDSTCRASVVDAGEGERAVPTGTVKWTLERGSFPDGDSCELAPRPNSNSESFCVLTYRPDAAGTPAGTRIPIAVAYGGSAVHAPSKAAAAGDDLSSIVCVGLWTADCEGKVPKPNEVQTCVAAWQRCEGFGNSNTKPGTFDMSGLPVTPARIEAPVGCGEADSKRRRITAAQEQNALTEDERCLINTSVNAEGEEGDDAAAQVERLNKLRELRAQVDYRRTILVTGTLLKLRRSLEGIQGNDLHSQYTRRTVNGITAAFGIAIDKVYDMFLEPGAFHFQRGGKDVFGWVRETFDAPRYCVGAFDTEDPNFFTCVEFVDAINAQIAEDAQILLAVQRRLGLDKKPGSSKTKKSALLRLRAAGVPVSSAAAVIQPLPRGPVPKRQPLPLATGTTELAVGQNGTLNLQFSKQTRQFLSALRRRGKKTLNVVIEVRSSRAGILTTSRQKVRLRLPKR